MDSQLLEFVALDSIADTGNPQARTARAIWLQFIALFGSVNQKIN